MACQALACPAATLHPPYIGAPVRAHMYLGNVAPAAEPVAGKASWLTGPFIEASLEPIRHKRTLGQG